MSHFKILNTISSLPALLWGSPLHLGVSLFSWSEGTKSLLDVASQRVSASPHGAGHDAHLLGSSRLGFETSALFPTDSKGHGWDMGHSPLPAQPPSSSALPGDRESFTPTSFQGLVGATGYHHSHGWDTLG